MPQIVFPLWPVDVKTRVSRAGLDGVFSSSVAFAELCSQPHVSVANVFQEQAIANLGICLNVVDWKRNVSSSRYLGQRAVYLNEIFCN